MGYFKIKNCAKIDLQVLIYFNNLIHNSCKSFRLDYLGVCFSGPVNIFIRFERLFWLLFFFYSSPSAKLCLEKGTIEVCVFDTLIQ